MRTLDINTILLDPEDQYLLNEYNWKLKYTGHITANKNNKTIAVIIKAFLWLFFVP